MGADKYTKEFYESIMQEIKMHQDFGERNPVDIGIECGYSEDDVMGMIYMCQDIIASESPEIPVRENWELEGIIPYEEFMKIDFPKTMEVGIDLTYLISQACDELGLDFCSMSSALMKSDRIKNNTFSEYFKDDESGRNYVIKGFREITKWMAFYGEVYDRFNNKNLTVDDIAAQSIYSGYAIGYTVQAIKLEKETEFHPLHSIILKANGWDRKSDQTTDKEELKKQ